MYVDSKGLGKQLVEGKCIALCQNKVSELRPPSSQRLRARATAAYADNLYIPTDVVKMLASYKNTNRFFTTSRHLAIVQHNTKFATVHGQVRVGSCSVEYEYSLLHQFSCVVAHGMPYTSILLGTRYVSIQ